VNAPLAEERAKFGGLGFPRLAGRLEKWAWRNADMVLPVSHVLAGKIGGAGVDKNRVEVIPNAIDVSRFSPDGDVQEAKRDLGLSDKLVLGFIGFVREWNGLEALLNVLAEQPGSSHLQLVIVGDGPAISTLSAEAERLGIGMRVTFAGLVERDKLPLYLAAFDIAVIPKCVSYCSPLKLFEYMMAGKAIIAPDQPNIREILTDGEDAVLFPAENEMALKQAVLRLAADANLRQRLGHAARKTILTRSYTWVSNASRVTAAASELTKTGISP
jgi:glycosyltransferase involved in cell wall biosynthesis